jgi:hypothetical protein
LAAGVEAIDVNFALNRTVQFTAGALTTQRAFVIQAPTYAFATGPASTITTAATLAITGAPGTGTNAIITNSLAFWVQAGNTVLAGKLGVNTLTPSANIAVNGSIHVGGDSDPGDNNLAVDGQIVLTEPVADDTATGLVEDVVFGETIAIGDLLYLKSDGKYYLADANGATTMPGLRMALAAGNNTDTRKVLISGRIWAATKFPTFTIGGLIYASAATTGAVTQTKPSGSGDQVQVIGYAYHADKMVFMPSSTLVEIV